jgi:hypothetical protein
MLFMQLEGRVVAASTGGDRKIYLVAGSIYDELVKGQKAPVIVIPVKTGIQENQLLMDSRFRGSDGLGDFLRDHQSVASKNGFGGS